MGRKKTLHNRDSLILDAACLLFSKTSYERTTLDDIAIQAGISKGSIYLEFPSKEEILYHLLQRFKTQELADMRRIAAKKSGSPLGLLKTMLVHNIGTIYDSMQQTQLSIEDLMQSREHLYHRLKPFIESRLSLIESLLKRAETAGEIPQLLGEEAHKAHLIMLALRGVLPPYREGAQRHQLQAEGAELLDLVLNGLRHHAATL